MFLSLEFPGGDRKISLLARDLAHDKGYKTWMKPLDYASERNRVDRAVVLANNSLADGSQKLISTIYNRFTWESTTGWEYWTEDYDKVLLHALVVSHALNVPLHVHRSFDDRLQEAAESAGIKLEVVRADYSIAEFTVHNEQLQSKLEAEEFVRLTNVVMPKDTTAIELF